MTENSTGRGLRSRARRQSTLTREAIEEVLYDKAYSWELVAGSDVMATTVGVLPKIGGADGNVYYAGLITVAEGAAPIPPYIDYGNQISIGFNLLQPTVAMTYAAINSDAGQQYWPAEGHDQVPAGVYLAVWFSVDGGPPPYAFPEGWTPGNTTGSGPVLPLTGLSFAPGSPDERVYAGLVYIDHALTADDLTYGDGHHWLLYVKDTALTLYGYNNGQQATVGDPADVYVAMWDDNDGLPPTAFPEGWTFRPYGLGPIAITDENAGGLIGDVAYVVSGYVYNYDEAGGKLYGNWRGVLGNGVYDMQVGDTFVVRNFAADRMQLVSVAGTITVTGAGGSAAVTPDDTAEFSIRSSELGYWPFIERFDLANKKWLPRIPLPQLSIPASIFGAPWDVAANYSSGSTLQHNSHMWTANADTAAGDEPGVSPKWDMTDPPAALKPFASEGGIGGVIDGKLYFGGGDGDDITGQEFFCYDPADDSITRLADMEGDGWYADYSAYGVVGGKLWYCNSGASEGGNDMRCYDPATDEWTLVAVTGARTLDYYAPDQAQGFEIDGKLWFAYNGAASVFDPVALTVTAKAARTPGPHTEGALFLVDGKLRVYGGEVGYPVAMEYDPARDTWTDLDNVAVPLVQKYASGSESFSVTRDRVPYAVTGAHTADDARTVGIYGLTGVAFDQPRPARLQDALTPPVHLLHCQTFTGGKAPFLEQPDGSWVATVSGFLSNGDIITMQPVDVAGTAATVTLSVARRSITNGDTLYSVDLTAGERSWTKAFTAWFGYDTSTDSAFPKPTIDGTPNVREFGYYVVKLTLTDVVFA